MKISLTVIKGPRTGKTLVFYEPGTFLIGRSDHADFQLSSDDPFASRSHVFLEICPPRIRLQALGTPNEPHVNGRAVAESDLAHGDVIELGFTHIKVGIEGRLEPRVHDCVVCGGSTELLPGDSLPDFCMKCTEREEEQARRGFAEEEAIGIRCRKCLADQRDTANLDGRCDELRDVASYECQSCAGDSEEGGEIGAYSIVSELGAGGTGPVFRVRHTLTGRVLALKLMSDIDEDILARRFAREVRRQKKFVHPNLVRFVESGLDDLGRPFLVTEFLTGGDLDGLIATRRRLDRRVAVRIVDDVLQGLEFLHTRDTLHSDIKPSNILLDGETGVAKLADSGLAVSSARAGCTRFINRGTGMGPLMFIPPEQVLNVRASSQHVDTYAVGVALYYLLTGRYTFNFPTPDEVADFRSESSRPIGSNDEALRLLMQRDEIDHPFRVILDESPIPVRERDATIPAALAEIIDRAVSKDVEQRFASAKAFRLALAQTA